MLVYVKAFRLMEEQNVSQYFLVKNPNNPDRIGGATYDKMRANQPINTSTLDKLCKHLNCQPGDLVEYIDDNDTEKLEAAKKAIEEIQKRRKSKSRNI